MPPPRTVPVAIDDIVLAAESVPAECEGKAPPLDTLHDKARALHGALVTLRVEPGARVLAKFPPTDSGAPPNSEAAADDTARAASGSINGTSTGSPSPPGGSCSEEERARILQPGATLVVHARMPAADDPAAVGPALQRAIRRTSALPCCLVRDATDGSELLVSAPFTVIELEHDADANAGAGGIDSAARECARRALLGASVRATFAHALPDDGRPKLTVYMM
jgi:hypothetical protein